VCAHTLPTYIGEVGDCKSLCEESLNEESLGEESLSEESLREEPLREPLRESLLLPVRRRENCLTRPP
jgi:hypothetical protein